jgi:hypothetical protein
MAHPYHHALSSQKKWGGKVADYLPIHNWFDASKAFLADFRHRALRHHAEGIFWAEEVFGVTITNSDGKVVPVRFIAEQHVKEDLGWIPTLQDWFKNLRVQPWMAKAGDRQVACGEQMVTDNPGTFGAEIRAMDPLQTQIPTDEPMASRGE